MSAISTMVRHGSRRRYYQSEQMLGALQSSTSLPITFFDNDDNNKLSSTTTIQNRSYHATNRNELLPFIAAGVLVGAGVYTFRTLQQIDTDWEDYYHDLEEYKAVTGIDPEEQQQSSSSSSSSSTSSNRSDNTDLSSFFTGGTLAIDIGTSRLKLSHQQSLSKNKNAKPSVIVDREGHRSTPAMAWKKDGEDILIGRLAASRSFDTRGGSIVHPQDVLLGNNEQLDGNTMAAIQQTLRDVASNALDQALGGSAGSSMKSSNNPLFVLDTSMATPGSYNVRPVITYPAQSTATSSPPKQYQQALNGFTSPEGIAEYVSEPVAIVSGAEYYNLLPTSGASGLVLVVDVGGTKTQVSMVLGDEVLYSSSLPFGGDTYIDLLVSKLASDFFGPSAENDDNSTDLSAKPRLNDPTALQRLYEESTKAVHELSNKTRSEINIPYLTMDLETRQPKHLEVGMPRKVIDNEFESWLENKLVPHLQSSGSNLLSQALPPPTNLSSLFSSTIMSALEQTSLTPMQLRAVLVVGGGARIPLVQSSMKESVGYLAGELDKLVILDGELLGELCVLGAVSRKSKS